MTAPINSSSVTAAVTSAAASAGSGVGPANAGDQIASFIERVVPWPAPGEAGFINLHWLGRNHGSMPGRPFTDPKAFMSVAQWGAVHPEAMKDIYFCLTRQSTMKAGKSGKPRAVRSKPNATHAKALWIDADVKADQPEKCYTSTAALVTALQKFLADAALPGPSAIVASGSGGLHIYWISNRVLTTDEWRLYAEGLKTLAVKHGFKCDAGLTTDAARVLRVPGTFNRKHDPAKPVVLLDLGQDYDFGRDLAHVATMHSVEATAAAPAARPPFDLSAFSGKMAPAFAAKLDARNDNLAEGINTYDDTPLNPDAIFKFCPHFADAAIAHGKGYSQGLWMLDVLAATFMDDGRRWAHYFSKGYATYSRAENDAMYDRKLKDREQLGLGWPSCDAFQNEGCKLCATCVYKGKIRSPLNLASRFVPPFEEEAKQAEKGGALPVAAIRALYEAKAARETLFGTLNETYAVVRYGGEILVASVVGPEVSPMKPEEFHRMFANLRFQEGKRSVEISRLWWEWPGRREFLGRGVVFEPGGRLEIADDMLNLWRGYGIEDKRGDWPRMHSHIVNVICSGRQDHYDYLIRWMAYAVQHPNEPIGVAVAFRGAQGAGKGVVARALGKIFGKHFAHIANGEQLTGRFNASVATSCAVFLDEALWAGDKKGESILKALITEPRLQLEAKFRDPIMVDNRLRIIVASNEDWCVPAGVGDRRWFVLDVANTYAGMGHRDYWTALYAEVDNGGVQAMFHDLLKIDLTGFDVRVVPHTAAKAQQQMHSLQGTNAWLYSVLQQSAIGSERWQDTGLLIDTEQAYGCYQNFSKQQRQYRPDDKPVWSKKMREALGECLADMRPGKSKDLSRDRKFKLAPLTACRHRFANRIGAPNIEWQAEGDAQYEAPEPARQTTEDVGQVAEADCLAKPGLQRAIAQAAADGELVQSRT